MSGNRLQQFARSVLLGCLAAAGSPGCRPEAPVGAAPESSELGPGGLYSPFGPEHKSTTPRKAIGRPEAFAADPSAPPPAVLFGEDGPAMTMPLSPVTVSVNTANASGPATTAAGERMVTVTQQEAAALQEAIAAVTSDPRKGIALLEQFLLRRPDVCVAYEWLGVAHNLLGEFNRAITPLDMALSIEPQRASALLQRGTAYVRLGRHDRAIYDLDKAESLGLKEPALYLFRAVAHLNSGKATSAASDAATAVELAPTSPDALYVRALARVQLGKRDEAKQDFAQAVKLGLDSNSQAVGRRIFGDPGGK